MHGVVCDEGRCVELVKGRWKARPGIKLCDGFTAKGCRSARVG